MTMLNYKLIFHRHPTHTYHRDQDQTFGITLNSRKMTNPTRDGLCAISVLTSLLCIVVQLHNSGITCGGSTTLRIAGVPTKLAEISLNSPQLVLTGTEEGDKSEKRSRSTKERQRAKFRQCWLNEDETDENGDKLRTYIVPDKDDKFKAICSVCYKSIRIDNLGKCALTQHARTLTHKKRMDQIKRGVMPENLMC